MDHKTVDTFALTMSFSSSASGRKSISEVSRSISLLCRLIPLPVLRGDPSRLRNSRFCRPFTFPETRVLQSLLAHIPSNDSSPKSTLLTLPETTVLQSLLYSHSLKRQFPKVYFTQLPEMTALQSLLYSHSLKRQFSKVYFTHTP